MAGADERPGHRALAVGLVCLVTVVAFETMSVATILPDVVRHIGGLRLYGWALTGLALGEILGIVGAGAWVDRANPVRPITAGLALYVVGLLVSGLAPTMEVVVIGRVLQGFGSGTVPAVAYASIGRGIPEAERPKVFAWLSTAWIVPSLVGPAAASLVSEHLGWRWVFLGLIPIVVGVGAFALRPVAALGAPPGTGADDASGRRMFVLAMGLVIGAGLALAALQSSSPGLVAAGVGVGGAVLLAAFVRVAPSGTLRAARGMPAAVASRGLLTFAFFGVDGFVSLALVKVRGESTVFAGIVLSSAAFTWTAGSWIAARTIGRVGPRALVTAGLAAVAGGIVAFASVAGTGAPTWLAVPAWLLGGLGMGLAYSPLSQAVLSDAEESKMGAASSALQLSDVLGVALGAGMSGALVAIADRQRWRIDGSTVLAGLTASWVVTVGVALVGLLAARGVLTRIASMEHPSPVT